MITVNEGQAKKRKPVTRKTDHELIQEMENVMTYSEANAPTIGEPMNQVEYDLPFCRHYNKYLPLQRCHCRALNAISSLTFTMSGSGCC